MFNLVIFGPPGSGKGTQSVKIAESFDLVHISTGDVFRREIRSGSELGKKVKGIIEKGELVSDELLIEILENEIDKFDDPRGFIFDGFPRTIRQAEDLDRLLGQKDEEVDLVLALEVNDAEIKERLLKRAKIEGRKDDTEEVIENRINVYNEQTQPLLDYYKAQGKLQTVNGIGSIGDVFGSLSEVIEERI